MGKNPTKKNTPDGVRKTEKKPKGKNKKKKQKKADR